MMPATFRRVRRWFDTSSPRVSRPRRRLEVEQLEERALLVAGTWTQVIAPPARVGTMMLLPNGTVMAQGGGGDNTSNRWYNLTPDSSGSYATGTWKQLVSMHTARLYFASNVLSSDKVLVIGGEYTGSNLQTFTNSGEIYSLSTRQWTAIRRFPNSEFGDDPSTVLANGNVLAGYINGPQTYFYNPSTNSWSAAGTKLDGDQSDEEAWVALPNGNILSYSIFASENSGNNMAQVYNQNTNTWSETGGLPVALSNGAVGSELGPGLMLPNGMVFQLGANGNTALYDYQANTWTAGPVIPNGQAADDAPGAILPDGQVIFASDTPLFGTGTNLYNYDYTTNTITQLTLPTALQNNLNGTPAYPTRMLMLPSGQLLFSSGDTSTNQLWIFTPSDGPQTAWMPAVTSTTNTGSNQYSLTGTLLAGISEGAAYGDDAEMSSNYPLVKLVSSTGSVTYATTSNWSKKGISAVGDATSQTVTFTLPSTLAHGTYSLYAIANGISSTAFSFTFSPAAAANSSTPSASAATAGAADLRTLRSLTPSLLQSQGDGTSPAAAPASSIGAAGLPGIHADSLFFSSPERTTPATARQAGSTARQAVQTTGETHGAAGSYHYALLDGGGEEEAAVGTDAVDEVFAGL
jgi:hypothetical protein